MNARLRHWLRDERGLALVMVVGMLAALSVSVTTVIYMASSSARTSELDKARQLAFALAEAGINNANAVLNEPSNNALEPSTLPSSEATASEGAYEGGTAKWWGVLVGNTWTLHGLGIVRNPTGGADVRRELTVTVVVASSLTQPLNNQSWNYMFSKRTGNECDMTLNNSVTVADPIYAVGNLCFENSVQVTNGPLVVEGYLWQKNSSSVGSSGSPINEAHVVLGCKYGGTTPSPLQAPCLYGAQPTNSNVWATVLDSTSPGITPPTADFAGWYADGASLNSLAECNVVSGTPPTFDGDAVRNNSVATVQNLTPASSYTCRKTSGTTTVAELSWDAIAKTLTLAGTMYIDGSAKVTDTATVYNGQATLYLSGTFLVADSAKLCAAVSGGNCTFTSWDPNTELLAIVADGTGGEAGTGNSIKVDNSSHFQGALYGTEAIELGNSTSVEGPMIASHIKLTNSVSTHSFGTVHTVPAGMPGNPSVYAQPQTPTNFSG